MAIKTFLADGTWVTGLPATSDHGYRTLKYSGSLGGGTLRVYTQGEERDSATKTRLSVPVPDAKLSAASLDDNGDVIQQISFVSSGIIEVRLSGSTSPTAVVMVE